MDTIHELVYMHMTTCHVAVHGQISCMPMPRCYAVTLILDMADTDTNICLSDDVVGQKGTEFHCALEGVNTPNLSPENCSGYFERIWRAQGGAVRPSRPPLDDGVTNDIVGFFLDQTAESILQSKYPPL